MWEQPEYTRQLDRILHAKGINVWVDYWGYDCSPRLAMVVQTGYLLCTISVKCLRGE